MNIFASIYLQKIIVKLQLYCKNEKFKISVESKKKHRHAVCKLRTG